MKEYDKTKNIGINLLRIYAVFLVLILHFLGHGGLLMGTTINTPQYKIVWFLEILAYPAVDIFALISGYVYYKNNKIKKVFYNWFKLWIAIVFYFLLCSFIFNIFTDVSVLKIDYLKSFFPITNNLLWYFTAYSGLVIVMPVLNRGLENLDDNKSKKLFWLIIVIFSMFEIIAKEFVFYNGYSFVWIMILFILGSLIKKCNIGNKLSNIKIIVIIILLFLLTYFYKIYGLEFNIFNKPITKDLFVNYTSPTILINSILLLVLFSRFKFNDVFSKIICFISSSAFFVYALNENYFIRDNYIINSFIKYNSSPVITIVMNVLLYSIIFFILAITVDKIRCYLFEKLKINNLISKTSTIFDKLNNYY